MKYWVCDIHNEFGEGKINCYDCALIPFNKKVRELLEERYIIQKEIDKLIKEFRLKFTYNKGSANVKKTYELAAGKCPWGTRSV
jgi:hypothetical protein